MLYTLMGLVLVAGSTDPMDTVETIQAMHLTKSVCEAKAVFLAEEVGYARCRPETETRTDYVNGKEPYIDTRTRIQLPSGRIIELQYWRGYWDYPSDLEEEDLKLVEDWTHFKFSKCSSHCIK